MLVEDRELSEEEWEVESTGLTGHGKRGESRTRRFLAWRLNGEGRAACCCVLHKQYFTSHGRGRELHDRLVSHFRTHDMLAVRLTH